MEKEKRKAHAEVTKAIKLGIIKRGACYCGSTKGEAHHNDYSKPLEVMWLCHKHHLLFHKRLKYGFYYHPVYKKLLDKKPTA